MKTILKTAGAAFFALSTAAFAAPFTIVGGVDDSIPFGDSGPQDDNSPENDFLERFELGSTVVVDGETFYTLGGYSEASIELDMTRNIKVELFGWQAGFFNTFSLKDTDIGREDGEGSFTFATALDAPIREVLIPQVSTSDFAEFEFSSNRADNTTFAGSVTNGDPNLLSGANFFASFGPGKEDATSGRVLWLFYDDFGVSGDNHDDLVIRISAVPLPAGLVLMMTGLGALALRRRKAA